MSSIRPDTFSGIEFGLTSSFIPYSRGKKDPFKDFSNYNLSYPNENYGLMLAQTAQQTLQDVDGGYKSFFKLLEKKIKGEYQKPINTPQYLNKAGRYKVTFPRDSLTFKSNNVTLGMSIKFRKLNKYTGKELTFRIPASIKPHQIREVALLPIRNGKHYKISFSYEIKKVQKLELDSTKYLGIDLGVNNFASLIDNTTGTAILLDGKYLKSLNWSYNTENAKLQSIKDKQGITGLTKRQNRLLNKRENAISEAINRMVNFVIEHAITNKIGNIVCLSWDGVKQGNKNNRNFVQIPFDKFRTRLESKCKLYEGMKYHGEESEAYTSRTDALNFDTIEDHWYKDARRIERGLYSSITGHLINADINGAINQIRKVAGDVPAREIISMGRFNRPARIRLAYELANFSQTNLNDMCCSTEQPTVQSSHL
jgi:transposase